MVQGKLLDSLKKIRLGLDNCDAEWGKDQSQYKDFGLWRSGSQEKTCIYILLCDQYFYLEQFQEVMDLLQN
jgi:hypothetical protein